MAELYEILRPESKYFDHKHYDTQEDYNQALRVSTTVYVGNLSFYTTQDSIYELFSRAGEVVKIIMGIDNDGNTCGFCFVIYATHEEAAKAVQFISKSKLNQRVIRVDWDPGYKEGRQKGRGSHGRQRRDDFRMKDDADRPNLRQKFDKRGGGERRGGYREKRGEWRDKRQRQFSNDFGNQGRKYRQKQVQPQIVNKKIEKKVQEIEEDY